MDALLNIFDRRKLAYLAEYIFAPIRSIFGVMSVENREYIYSMLAESMNAQVSLSVIFNDMIKGATNNPPVSKFARTCRRGLLEKDDFTYFLHDTYLLPPHELKILQVGNKTKSIELVCRYLIEQFEKQMTFNKYVFMNGLTYVGGAPVSVGVAVLAGSLLTGLRRTSEKQDQVFFKIADMATTYWPHMLVVCTLVIVGHQLLLTRVNTHRAIYKRLGLFSLYDLEQEIKLSALCAALLPTRLSTSDLLRTLSQMFSGNHQLKEKIDRALYKVHDLPLIDVFGLFLNPNLISKVRSKAPLGTPEQIGSGFLFAARIGRLEYKTLMLAHYYLLVFVCMAFSSAIYIPLTMLVSGL